jgi:hypothetical protein
MNPKEAIIQAIDQLPNSRLPDLLVFIQKLQEKPITEQWAGALMSESSLRKIGCYQRKMRHGRICSQ